MRSTVGSARLRHAGEDLFDALSKTQPRLARSSVLKVGSILPAFAFLQRKSVALARWQGSRLPLSQATLVLTALRRENSIRADPTVDR